MFLVAGLWAIIGLIVSLTMNLGLLEPPGPFSAIDWHIHEMIYGYVVAVIVGFLFTAIPNWTGRMPLQGQALLLLVLLWLGGRMGLAFSHWFGLWLPAAVDVLFLVAVLAVASREIVAGRNWRNTPVLIILLVLIVCNILFYLEVSGRLDLGGFAWRLAIGTIVTLITLIGGRIIPSFTRNWLVKHEIKRLPASFGVIDRVALALTAVAFVGWAVAPDQLPVRVVLLLAALTNLLRVARWSGVLTSTEPLLAVLHIGFLWVPIGLTLLALGDWVLALPASAGLHALTIGAIGTMTLAVMSRATLGHTGHALHADSGLTAAFVLITVSSVVRIVSPLSSQGYVTLLLAAAVAWILAFSVFLAQCGPMLVSSKRAKVQAS